MEYETPIDQIRPINTSNKQLDPSSVMDYNEILKGMKPQVQVQSQPQENTMSMENETIYAQTQPQPQVQQSQGYEPQVQIIQPPIYQQQQQLPQIQYQIQEREQKHKEVKGVFSINDIENKDYIFIIVAISIVFSDGMQTNISKVLPNLYKDGKSSMIGLMFNGLVIAVALYLSRKVKINV